MKEMKSEKTKSIEANEVHYTLIKSIPTSPHGPVRKTHLNCHCTPRQNMWTLFLVLTLKLAGEKTYRQSGRHQIISNFKTHANHLALPELMSWRHSGWKLFKLIQRRQIGLSSIRKQADTEQEVQPNYTCLSNENFIWAEMKPPSNFF